MSFVRKMSNIVVIFDHNGKLSVVGKTKTQVIIKCISITRNPESTANALSVPLLCSSR